MVPTKNYHSNQQIHPSHSFQIDMNDFLEDEVLTKVKRKGMYKLLLQCAV